LRGRQYGSVPRSTAAGHSAAAAGTHFHGGPL
jgi:hypothetical protein